MLRDCHSNSNDFKANIERRLFTVKAAYFVFQQDVNASPSAQSTRHFKFMNPLPSHTFSFSRERWVFTVFLAKRHMTVENKILQIKYIITSKGCFSLITTLQRQLYIFYTFNFLYRTPLNFCMRYNSLIWPKGFSLTDGKRIINMVMVIVTFNM